MGGHWHRQEKGILSTTESITGQLRQLSLRLKPGVPGHEGGGTRMPSLIPVPLCVLKDAHLLRSSRAPWGMTGRCFPCFIDV